MSIKNIYIGRNRAEDILNIIKPKEAEFLYGDDNYGVGYCPFKYTNERGQETGVTVRTSNRDYIKIDKRLLETNMYRCDEEEINHELILGFKWDKDRKIYIINNELIHYIMSHYTKGRNYMVFKEDLLNKEWFHGVAKLF